MPRVWDAYLSERDKALLELLPPRKAVGFGATPAVLLVDNYKAALGPRAPLLEAVREAPAAIGEEAWQAVERIQALLQFARSSGIPVIHVTGLTDASIPGWNVSIHAGERRGDLSLQKPDEHAYYEIMPECAPLPGEPVLRKTAPSAFWGTPLAGLLNYLAVDTLIVAGEATSGCVRATVTDAASYRFRTVVAEDCVYDRYEAGRAMSLFDMHRNYADVLALEEVLDHLQVMRVRSGFGPRGGGR